MSGPAAEPGRLHLHPDGGRVRRQGVAGRASRACWRPWSPQTGRPARVVYPRDVDMRVTGKRHPYLSRYKVGFDSGRADRGARPRALLRRRLRRRPLAGRARAVDAPRRQRVFHPAHDRHGHGLPHESPVQHRDARLRRPAGDRGDRERHRGRRGLPRPRPARSAPAELLRRRGSRHHPLRRGRREQHAAEGARPAGRDVRIREPARRGGPVQRGVADPCSAGWR